MSQSISSETNPPLLRKGEYHPPNPTDLRSPCPVVNSLANHGYIPRDGRNVRASELKDAMSVLGVSITLRQLLTSIAYLEHRDPPPPSSSSSKQPATVFHRLISILLNPIQSLLHLLSILRNPLASLFGNFALRSPGQIDSLGIPCLNLSELSRHNAVEHDVSISRRDFLQGDNHTPQTDLISTLLSSAHDNGTALTIADWARFRTGRISQQRRENPHLDFGKPQDMMGLAETAFIQTTFGEKRGGGKWEVPVSYLKALFGEERLPVEEGWRPRRWWSVGILELTAQARGFGKVVQGIEEGKREGKGE